MSTVDERLDSVHEFLKQAELAADRRVSENMVVIDPGIIALVKAIRELAEAVDELKREIKP